MAFLTSKRFFCSDLAWCCQDWSENIVQTEFIFLRKKVRSLTFLKMISPNMSHSHPSQRDKVSNGSLTKLVHTQQISSPRPSCSLSENGPLP